MRKITESWCNPGSKGVGGMPSQQTLQRTAFVDSFRIAVRNPDRELVFYVEHEAAVWMVTAQKARWSRNRSEGCLILNKALKAHTSEEREALKYRPSLTLADIRRDAKYTYRHHVGDGLFAQTLKDLPGLAIRLKGDRQRTTETISKQDGELLYRRVIAILLHRTDETRPQS